MYLFKTTTNKWIFGDTIKDECPAGTFRIQFNNTYTLVDIRYARDGRYYKQNEPLTSFKDSSGTSYSTSEDLLTAANGFFVGASSSIPTDGDGNYIYNATEPRTLSCEYTRPSNTTTRPVNGAINETVSVIKELLAADSKQAANLDGGGGVVINGSIVSNNTSDVGRQFGIIFLREDISPIIADNSVQTILYANQGKRIMVVYVTMEAQSAGSDMVIGRFNLPFEYQCKADSKALKALLFDVTGGTTVSGSKYMVTVNVQVQK